jgi:hypothetical protein
METDAGLGAPELTVIIAGVAFLWFITSRVFVRAGYSRWWTLTIFVPLLNLYMASKLIMKAGYSIWWLLVLLLPPVNFLIVMMFVFGEWPADRRLYRTVKVSP